MNLGRKQAFENESLRFDRLVHTEPFAAVVELERGLYSVESKTKIVVKHLELPCGDL